MAKPYNRALYANINGKLVRLGEKPLACRECGLPTWEVASCPKCADKKLIGVCRNTLYHRHQPGYFIIHAPNQHYCSARCELPENGLYSVGLLINGVTIEVEFSRLQHTPQHVLDMMKSQASHGIISPDPNAVVAPETLVHAIDVRKEETNREFVERTSLFLSPDPSTDKLSCIFKAPCSDITVQDFLDGTPPPPFFDASKDWALRLKCDLRPYGLLDMDRLLWEQLDPQADKWVDEQGKQLLVIEFIERPQEHRTTKITVPPVPKVVTEESALLAWFKQHACQEMTLPRARDKKTLYMPVGGGIAVASLYGKTYYDAFLKDFAAQKPDIVSPFVANRAWVFFEMDDKEREEWIAHYDQVRKACPPRSFGALKYLMTEDLMEAYPKYSTYVLDDPEKDILYQDMANDYVKLEKAGFPVYDGTVKLDKKKKKKKKKKTVSAAAPPPPPPPPPDFSNEPKRLKISFSLPDNPYDDVSDLESE